MVLKMPPEDAFHWAMIDTCRTLQLAADSPLRITNEGEKKRRQKREENLQPQVFRHCRVKKNPILVLCFWRAGEGTICTETKGETQLDPTCLYSSLSCKHQGSRNLSASCSSSPSSGFSFPSCCSHTLATLFCDTQPLQTGMSSWHLHRGSGARPSLF